MEIGKWKLLSIMPSLPVLLAQGFTPLVQQSEKVTVGQPIASHVQSSQVTISIADELQIPIHTAAKYLQKRPGDTVHPGEVIAEKKGFLGTLQGKIVGNIEGIITQFEKETGVLVIRVTHTDPMPEDIMHAPIEGTVIMSTNEKIIIETDKYVYSGKKGIGPTVTDKVLHLAIKPSESVMTHHLTYDAIGKIIVGTFFSKDTLIKGVSMGVGGILGTKILEEDLSYLRQRNVSIPVVEIDEDIMVLLKNWNGKQAFVNGEGKTIILLYE